MSKRVRGVQRKSLGEGKKIRRASVIADRQGVGEKTVKGGKEENCTQAGVGGM